MSELATNYAWSRLSVDVYCLQHPDRYCVSAKSLAAHLTGLAWWIEHGPDERGLRALQRALDGTPQLEKPPIPPERGALTIADVATAADGNNYTQAVTAWATSTWTAYAPLHHTARAWVGRAFPG